MKRHLSLFSSKQNRLQSCMLTILKKSFVLMAFILLNVTHTQAQDYYRKHIIICVDQTIQGPDKINTTKELYGVLKELLCNNSLPNNPNLSVKGLNLSPDEPFFDPSVDQLSLFITVITGNGTPLSYDYKAIHSYCYTHPNTSGQNLANFVLTRFIHNRGSYQGCGMTVEDFLENNLKPLFDGSDEIRRLASGYVSLPSRIYPAILDFIDTSHSAEKYEVYIVSDFVAGDGQSLAKDNSTMISMMSSPNFYRLDDYLNKIAKPFRYANEEVKIELRNQNNKQARIVGDWLRPKALDNTRFGDNFELNIKQASLGSSFFNIEAVTIPFFKNNQIITKQLELLVYNRKNHLLLIDTIFDYDMASIYDEGYYTLPKIKLNLPKVQQGDELLFEYAFHTVICDEDSEEILPYVFTSRKLVKMSSENFVIPKDKNLAKTIILSILAAALLIGFLIWLYIFRGKRAKPELKVDVNPISNTRYMCVKNCEETNHDCWYMEDEKDRRRIISFDITATMPKRALSQKQTYVIKYQVEDLDGNELFTFRPQLPNPDGTRKKLNTEYALEEVFDTSKKSVFEARVNVEAYVDGESNAINFDIDNVLDVKLKVRVYRRDGKSLVYIGDGEVEREYKFIVRPKLRNPNIWVAFDEGTTGSSIAYGVTGSWLDTNDINLVNRQYKETTSGGRTKTSSIFPSVIAIPDTSRAFTTKPPVEEFEEGLDFQFEGAETAGKNKFQSIKKFLGYKSPQNIKRSDGTVKTIEGQDLAHLLAKGLYNQLEAHYQSTKDENITGQFSDEYGRFDPQRAVVAVPNNYTRNKVQDMVDSVKRLGKFKEVHYLYESEGVMMTYLRQNLQQIVDKQNRVFVVLDMGGATINLTAFNVNVVMGANGNIQRIELDSLAKVGYYVGGDDIDYALIQLFYAIPSIRKALLENLNAQGKPESEQETLLREHQKKHKNALISMARKIKLDWIDKTNNVPNPADNVTTSFEDFYGFLGTQFSEFGVSIPDKTEDDRIFVANEKKSHNIMNEYVFRHITDAINELLHAKRFPSHRTIELILSGRSVLYPGVSKTIMKAFFGHRVEQWDGFMKKNDAGIVVFDDQKVKTAVAEGACWYAMYSRKILLQHNYVTSSFGFEDSKNTEKCYHALIENGTAFENGRIIAPVVHGKDLFDPEMINVKFLQMMGANTEEIIKNNIQHKKILLDEVKGSQIKTFIDRIEFEVDDKGNYDYRIYVSSFDEPITKESARAWRMDHEMQNEIKDENSAAFEFATINTNDYEEEETSFTPTHKTSTIDTSKTKTRLK